MPYIAIFVTILCWASAFPAIRYALTEFEPTELAAARFGVSALVFILLAWIVRPGLPRLRDLLLIGISGLCGITLYHIALNTGQQTVMAGAASFIINTAPVFTALLASAFLHESLRLGAWIGISVSFGGVTLIALSTNGAELELSIGALVILLAALLQATYFVLQRPLLRKYRPLQLTSFVIWAGALLAAPFLPAAIGAMSKAPIDSLAAIAFLGVFPGALAYTTWTYALKHFPVAQASGYLYLVPPIATAVGYLWLDEIPSSGALLGGAIAISGVAILSLSGKAPTGSGEMHSSRRQ